MSGNNRDKLIKTATDDLLVAKFVQDLGSKVRVDRNQIDNEHMAELRSVVADVGRDLEKVGAVPRGMAYVGSLSVHVFKSSLLRTMAFATVSELGDMTVDVADGALRELTGTTMATFGKSRQKLRSGF